MTEIIAAGVALAALIVIIACTFAGRKRPAPGPYVGLCLFDDPMDDTQEMPAVDVDEDITNPKVERIITALQRTDPGEREAVDWLLDQLLRAREEAA